MLIIFDLDDTLVDTSAVTTPYLLKKALEKMIENGLQIPDFDNALHLLYTLNQSALSAKEALQNFLEAQNKTLHFLPLAEKIVYESTPSAYQTQVVEGALELLKEFSYKHQLALVTFGKEEIQREKMAKAKIDPALFSKIFICPEKNKKPYYKTLFNSFDYLPSDIVVCGDRINIDLTPAKELGFNTVHFRYGRGTGFTGLKRDVDYTISSLCELREVVEFLALKKILVPDPETRYNAGILDTN